MRALKLARMRRREFDLLPDVEIAEVRRWA
jgi:hypothetical protein